MKRIIALVFIGALTAIGQPPAPPKAPPATPPAKVEAAKPPVAPVVSDALSKKFFKAEWEFTQASDQATAATQVVKEKQAVLQDVVKELTAACGDKFQPSMSQTRDPECVAKPPEPAKPEPPKK